jgi:signal transduction histidine kinase
MKKILIVDDDEIVRFALEEALSGKGFLTSQAADGNTALDCFLREQPDAVLLDLRMPGMDGIAVLKELRRADPDVPVIMITAYGDIPTAVEAIKLGAYDFVEKPPQLSRIILMVGRALEKAEMEREIRRLGKSVAEAEALRTAYSKLIELDRMKTAFLSTISHELRTPLTSVMGFAGLVRKKLAKGLHTDAEKAASEKDRLIKNMDIIIFEAEKLTRMINNILYMIEMEDDRAEWKQEPVSMRDIIESVVPAVAVPLEEKGIVFHREIEEGLPEIIGDSNRLALLVNNLILNAVKFTEQGSITCSAKGTPEGVRVSVRDTGTGIPDRDLTGIFDKFMQSGDSLTGKPSGLGIGLPICRHIVERHGGRIWVESAPGKGSEFIFVLPTGQGQVS